MTDLLGGLGIPPPPPAAGTPNATNKNYLGPDGYQLPDTYRANVPTGPPVSGYDDSDAYGTYHVNLATPVPYTPGFQSAPRYAQGDELIPPNNNYDPQAIAALQAQMVAAGLLKPNNFQLGSWSDQATMRAYRELLGYSNVRGTPYDQTLAQMRSVISQFGDTTTNAGRIRQPFIAELTDPAALRDTLQNVAVRSMGRPVTPEEENQFITSFQTLQQGQQKQKYDEAGAIDPQTGQYTGQGGTYIMPDAAAEATQSLIKNHGGDIATYDSFQKYKGFLSLLGGA